MAHIEQNCIVGMKILQEILLVPKAEQALDSNLFRGTEVSCSLDTLCYNTNENLAPAPSLSNYFNVGMLARSATSKHHFKSVSLLTLLFTGFKH